MRELSFNGSARKQHGSIELNDLDRTGAADAPWRGLDHKPGCALPTEFYTSAAIYARDL